MANFTGTILTTRGRNLLAKALTGVPLVFTRVGLGSGVWGQNTNPENLTSLVEQKISLPIQNVQVTGDGTARLRFVLTNQNLTEGFFLRELGVFAEDPQLGEILYAVAYASNPDFIPSRNTTTIELVVDVYVVVANAQQVSISISDTIVLATRQDVERVAQGIGLYDGAVTTPKIANNAVTEAKLADNAVTTNKIANLAVTTTKIADGAVTLSKLNTSVYSTTPAPNRIPLADSVGKLHAGWLPDTFSAYSRMRVGNSLPTTDVNEGDLFYRMNDNRLFVRRAGNWLEVDWQRLVQASPEWIAGRLRIQNNQLQISPDGVHWFNCIPAVGANTIELTSVDNTNYTILYWIPPGVTIIIRNSNHLPIVYAKDVEPAFSGTYWNNVVYEADIGLRPSNITISNGDSQYIWGHNASVSAFRHTNLTIVPIMNNSSTTENWASFSLNIRTNQRWLFTGVGQGAEGYGVLTYLSSGTAPATSYWLGTWFRQDGVQFTMTRITLTRLA